MLSHPTHERLISLGLPGMAKAFEDQRRSPDIAALSFEERIGLMVDREAAERDSKRLSTRLKFAALRQNAVVEDVDLRTPRSIDRALFQRLVAGDWIDRAEGLLITGPTGVGKSWIACALGQKACRDGRSVIYHPSCSAPVRGARARPRRRPLWPPAQKSRARPAPDPGRLGSVGAHRARTARSPRNPGGPPSTRFDDRHQPGSGRAMVRDHRQSDPRRRHPRPPRSQRPQAPDDRRKHAKAIS